MGEDFLRVFESLESGRSREKSAHETRLNAADALADAVEALNLETDDGRAFGDPPRVEMTPHVATLDAIAAALKAYREATGSPSRPEAP